MPATARAALKIQINKSDANDSHGLAQITRVGWFREVAVKAADNQELKVLIVAREVAIGNRASLKLTASRRRAPNPDISPG